MACIGCGGAGAEPKEKIITSTGHKEMGCTNCGTENEYNIGTCRCCELVDGSVKQKRVRWCTMCQAFICEPCESDYPKRAEAFLYSGWEKIKSAVKNK